MAPEPWPLWIVMAFKKTFIKINARTLNEKIDEMVLNEKISTKRNAYKVDA